MSEGNFLIGQQPGEVPQLSKGEANYREGQGDEICANCMHFVSPDQCSVVEGDIDLSGTSDLFEPLEGADVGAQLFGGLPDVGPAV